MLKSSVSSAPKAEQEKARVGRRWLHLPLCQVEHSQGRWKRGAAPNSVQAQSTHVFTLIPEPGKEPTFPRGNLQCLPLLQIFQDPPQPIPRRESYLNPQRSSKQSVPGWASQPSGDWLILSPAPSRPWAVAWSVLVNNQVLLPAVASCPSKSHSRSLQVELSDSHFALTRQVGGPILPSQHQG